MKPIIDISYWQQPALIDYDKLAGQVDGVILRAAYGVKADSAFNRHYAEFTKRGVPVGCYHYICEYVTVAEQVKVLLAAVSSKTFKLGYWCDEQLDQQPGFGIWVTAPLGATMDVLEVKGDWCRVGWNQWCMSNYNGMRYLEAN